MYLNLILILFLYLILHAFNFAWNAIELEKILRKAQRCWLGTAEICEILRNHRKFVLSQSPPYRPPGIAYFLHT